MKKLSTFLWLLLTPVLVTQADWTEGVSYAGGFGLPNATPEGILENLMLWILSILALIAALAFVISGVMFLTSGGDSDRAERAKKFVMYSIIGLIVALSGYIIIIFIDDVLMGRGGGGFYYY